MAAPRPTLLDLRMNSQMSNSSTTSKPLRSPRLHIAGEAPPELSPLDAFALQSRILAKQLQESTKEGNRVSRLPPLTTESPLVVQGRSDYFRSMYQDDDEEDEFEDDERSKMDVHGAGMKTEVEDAFDETQRPISMHPRMSTIPPTPVDYSTMPKLSRDAQPMGGGLADIDEQVDFGAMRTRSPSPLHHEVQSGQGHGTQDSSSYKDRSLPTPFVNKAHTSNSPAKTNLSTSYEDGLAPPRPFGAPRPSSSASSSTDPFGIDSNPSPAFMQSLPPRNSSRGSILNSQHVTPHMGGSFQRSPSVASDTGSLPRPSYNFSRPLSRAGTPGLDSPSRQASSDSQPSFILADETAHTPISVHSEAFADQQAEDASGAAPSYIYSKFALPRGKSIQRSEPTEQQSQSSSRWESTTMASEDSQRTPLGAPPSPPTRPSSSKGLTDDAVSAVYSMTRPSMDTSKVSMDSSRLAPTWSHPSNDGSRSSEEGPRGRPRLSPLHDANSVKAPSTADTSDSASTIRPTTAARSVAPSIAEMTAEEHLAKGIECHENGSLTKSTYHLRHAARLNNPTAMLLYALACRHGWGMRANQKEGVQWLRKAADYAGIEIADDEDQIKDGKHVDAVERRTRKAQFALSIYELGVSHMNGWGIEQDKPLALRCFEIAATWGDVDAMAETGFCYAQGIGCKKNLKKSAKYYRMAEAKGMSMVGNSWIHKAKYNEDDTGDKDANKRKARSKSRTRTMFGLKSN